MITIDDLTKLLQNIENKNQKDNAVSLRVTSNLGRVHNDSSMIFVFPDVAIGESGGLYDRDKFNSLAVDLFDGLDKSHLELASISTPNYIRFPSTRIITTTYDLSTKLEPSSRFFLEHSLAESICLKVTLLPDSKYFYENCCDLRLHFKREEGPPRGNFYYCDCDRINMKIRPQTRTRLQQVGY